MEKVTGWYNKSQPLLPICPTIACKLSDGGFPRLICEWAMGNLSAGKQAGGRAITERQSKVVASGSRQICLDVHCSYLCSHLQIRGESWSILPQPGPLGSIARQPDPERVRTVKLWWSHCEVLYGNKRKARESHPCFSHIGLWFGKGERQMKASCSHLYVTDFVLQVNLGGQCCSGDKENDPAESFR